MHLLCVSQGYPSSVAGSRKEARFDFRLVMKASFGGFPYVWSFRGAQVSLGTQLVVHIRLPVARRVRPKKGRDETKNTFLEIHQFSFSHIIYALSPFFFEIQTPRTKERWAEAPSALPRLVDLPQRHKSLQECLPGFLRLLAGSEETKGPHLCLNFSLE